MYKITGVIEDVPSPEGGYMTKKKTYYAAFSWTMEIKSFLIRIFYDEVRIEEVKTWKD